MKNAVDVLNQHINIQDVLAKLGAEMRPDKEFVRGCCPLHEGNNPSAFVANTSNNLWYCHTNCGGGDLFKFVMMKKNITFSQAIDWLSETFQVDVSTMERTRIIDRYQETLKHFIHSMTSTSTPILDSFPIPDDAEIKMLTTLRNFSTETIAYFGAFYLVKGTFISRKGKPFLLEKRIGFPIMQNNDTVGYSFRRTNSNQEVKWMHLPTGIQTQNLLYNYDNVKHGDAIFVVEGMYDVWAFHEVGKVAVATYGAKLTEEQYRLLLITGCDITLCYDGDEAGRKAQEKAVQMLRGKCNLATIELNEGEDPSSIGRDELNDYIQTAKRR